MIGFTHPQPSGGALILPQAATKFIVTKSVQMGSDFRQAFSPSLSGLKGSQACFNNGNYYSKVRCWLKTDSVD